MQKMWQKEATALNYRLYSAKVAKKINVISSNDVWSATIFACLWNQRKYVYRMTITT